MKNYISFVGAGCGKGLITQLGTEIIKDADAIVFDDLIDHSLLGIKKKNCETFYVGKRSGKHSMKQEEINALLVDCGKKFQHTVRLKGGDSFVFGRGGEEALALTKEGIDFQFIPGVSSCIAVAESVGIPVTHRGLAQSFTVVTGHSADEKEEDYSALARLSGTLIFLMGLSGLPEITKKLIANGKDKNTPCSVVSNGCSKKARRFDGTLDTIVENSKDAETPAIIVVGEVCKFNFSSTIQRPLDDFSVTVTGTKDFTQKLSKELKKQGATVHNQANLEIVPKKDFLPTDFEKDFDLLIFTSSNGVRVFFEELKKSKVDIRKLSGLKFACIGLGSAKTLEEYHIFADFIPSEYTAKRLGEELGRSEFKASRMLLLRAENGSVDLTYELEKANCNYTEIKCYSTEKTVKKHPPLSDDYIIFASASGVDSYFSANEKIVAEKVICIGEITAEALKKHTDVVPLVCKNHCIEGIINEIKKDRK